MTPQESLSLRERQLGRTMRIDHAYFNWNDPFPTQQQQDDKTHGRLPLITWWGTEYAAINDGSQDALIRARADAVRDYGNKVMLAWASEMNLDHPPWPDVEQPSDPAGFIAAWRRIHDIFQQAGVTNVVWVWAPNCESHPGGYNQASANNWTRYYPGDAYVDWVGIDGYNWGKGYITPWESMSHFATPIYRDYADKKPIILAETASAEIGGNKAQWITDAASWIKTHEDIRALVWFDQKSTSAHDWRIDSSPAAFAAFRALARDPAFTG
jgi:beta-mannanase